MTSNTSLPHGGNNESGDKKKEESDEVWGYLEAQSSFLGPSLWDNGDLKVGSNYTQFWMILIPVCVYLPALVFHILKFCLDFFIDEKTFPSRTSCQSTALFLGGGGI